MESKKFLLLCTGILALVFFMSFASALTITDKSVSLTDSSLSQSVIISSTPSESFTITGPFPPQTDSSGKVQFTLTPQGLTEDQTSVTFLVSAQKLSSVKFLESRSTVFNLIARNVSGIQDPFTITANYENTDFCSKETSSNVEVTIDDIKTIANPNTLKSFGNDEDYWYPLDTVQIDFKVKYNGDNSDDEFQDGQLDWALYTSDGNLISDGDENIKDLKDGKSETITITYKVDPSDLDVNTEDYVLYASATGTENYNDKTKTDKDICSSDSKDINIRMDDNFVILDNLQITPNPASCGTEVEITADVWNIGTEDQDDVSVRVFIDELNINQVVDIGSIDSFDNKNLDLKINIPENSQEKSYALKLWIYDSDNDVYVNSEEDNSKFEIPFPVSGSCSVTPTVGVTASLESVANAGKPLTVKATITNTGTKLQTFNIALTNYNSFASSATLDQNTIAVSAGSSKDVLITLNIDKNISGDQSFNIDVSAGGNKLVSQPVQFTLASGGVGGITGGIINQSNWYLWGIGALNVILVIIIIIVAIRIARS